MSVNLAVIASLDQWLDALCIQQPLSRQESNLRLELQHPAHGQVELPLHTTRLQHRGQQL